MHTCRGRGSYAESAVKTVMPCQLEHGHDLHQLLGLASQAVSRGSALLHQRCVLLRCAVHLTDRLTHLLQACALLDAG